VNEDLLIDAPLIPDPDVDHEMGSRDLALIADEELKGCRLLIVRRAILPIVVDGSAGGLLKVGVSFQATHGTRFVWARIVVELGQPEGAVFVDVKPDTKMDDLPVKFTVDVSGKLSASYGVKAGVGEETKTEFDVYYCAVHGTGAGTTKARWEFEENPQRKDGLGREQPLLMTLRETGRVTGNVSVYAKIVRSGLQGGLDAVAHLVLGPDEHHAPLTLEVPTRSA
jgi:hypothetical protein